MGNIYTYFVAENDAAAAATADAGPGGLPSLDAVDATVQAGSLMALLTGRPYEEVTGAKEWARLVSDPAHELAWVVSMPDAFTDALADADKREARRGRRALVADRGVLGRRGSGGAASAALVLAWARADRERQRPAPVLLDGPVAS